MSKGRGGDWARCGRGCRKGCQQSPSGPQGHRHPLVAVDEGVQAPGGCHHLPIIGSKGLTNCVRGGREESACSILYIMHGGGVRTGNLHSDLAVQIHVAVSGIVMVV